MSKNIAESGRLSPAQEYDTLREELNQSKKYVFERPLAIFGAGVALLTAEGVKLGSALPAILAGVLLFNFWFTINRLMSASRIVAYIQVVLEGDVPWIGWETSLRKYRIWIKEDPESKKKIIENELDPKAIPYALMYYPPIYLIHIAFVGLCLVSGVMSLYNEPCALNIAATSALAPISAVFGWYCWKWKPSKMRKLIERNIVIWKHALGIEDRKS